MKEHRVRINVNDRTIRTSPLKIRRYPLCYPVSQALSGDPPRIAGIFFLLASVYTVLLVFY